MLLLLTNWTSNCVIVNHYNFQKAIQLVIVTVMITKIVDVIGNCNDYILDVIVTSLIVNDVAITRK